MRSKRLCLSHVEELPSEITAFRRGRQCALTPGFSQPVGGSGRQSQVALPHA